MVVQVSTCGCRIGVGLVCPPFNLHFEADLPLDLRLGAGKHEMQPLLCPWAGEGGTGKGLGESASMCETDSSKYFSAQLHSLMGSILTLLYATSMWLDMADAIVRPICCSAHIFGFGDMYENPKNSLGWCSCHSFPARGRMLLGIVSDRESRAAFCAFGLFLLILGWDVAPSP